MPRKFTAPLDDQRCEGTVRLKDKSLARCMHKRVEGRRHCRQHEPYDCCGGNDEEPRDHCADCPEVLRKVDLPAKYKWVVKVDRQIVDWSVTKRDALRSAEAHSRMHPTSVIDITQRTKA